MKRFVKYLLLLMGAILLAAWLVLSLFDANRLKQPVLAWLNEHTELDAAIGNISFNPLHPYTLLAEDVRLGHWFSARQIYIQLANFSPLSGETRIATLDLIDSKLVIEDATELKLPSNLANIHIDELTTKNFSLDWHGWQLKGADLTLQDWQPRQEGQWQWGADMDLQGQARQLTQPHIEMAQLTFSGQVRQQQLQLSKLKSHLFDGLFDTQLTLDWPKQQVTLTAPTFSRNQLQFEQLPHLNGDWRLFINKASFDNISITSPTLISNAITGELRYLEWTPGSLPIASAKWQANEAVVDWLRLNQHQVELLSEAQQLSLNINGQAYEGSVSSELRWLPEQGRLDIDKLALQNTKFIWQPDMRWPLPEVRLHRLDLSNGELLSLDTNLPLSILGAELFLSDIAWSGGQWRGLTPRARAQANWNEIAFDNLIARQGSAQVTVDDSYVWLTQFASEALDGQLTLSGKLGLYPPYEMEGQVAAQQISLRPLSRWLKTERRFSGLAELNATLHGELDHPQSWQGQLALSAQEVFIENFALDSWLSHRLHEDYRSAKSVDTQLAALDLTQGDSFIYQLELTGSVNQGRWQLKDSALQSVRYLLALQGSLAIKQDWQLELGAINDQGCKELAINLNGPWQAPKLVLHQPKLTQPCIPWYKGQLAYPKSGLSGNLIQGVRALTQESDPQTALDSDSVN
ncbi:AsmA family protein [Oceanisphaera avium]|uniref:Uncharacterized protein n=1 Tax=Oceanisphaera avium TaxID=1903694 RepID=A0A1Y0CYK3_9GAMM|nr:AsmA-like C-terminal region-containing protein [Oceanisphaera avium]ART80400.1 hypothetical protein CBP12_09810 [Oceanisphaera avium]